MKVAILNNLFPPNSRGGAEEAAEIQANTFLVQGNEVVIITLAPPSVIPAKSMPPRRRGAGIQADGFKIYFLPHRNIFNYFNIGKHSAPVRFLWHIIDAFNFRLANDIGKILRQEKPDLVITHNLKGLSFLTPLKIAKLKIENWHVVHDIQLYTPSGLIVYGKENIFEHTGLPTRIYRFFTRRLFKYAEKVFFPSVWLLNFYRKNNFFVNQEKIYQPNEMGLDTRPPQSPSRSGEPESLIMEVGCPKVQKIGFLYVGQLEPHKGILFLLDVFESRCECRELHANAAKLHIVGDGSLMPEIKKRAERNPHIIVHGRVPREKLPEFYSRAKAVIFPSLVYENAPMVIAEAVPCGAPVICSRLGGAPELIREGENGATFTPGDANDLTEKIKQFLSM